jgi:hypothetical protein
MYKNPCTKTMEKATHRPPTTPPPGEPLTGVPLVSQKYKSPSPKYCKKIPALYRQAAGILQRLWASGGHCSLSYWVPTKNAMGDPSSGESDIHEVSRALNPARRPS